TSGKDACALLRGAIIVLWLLLCPVASGQKQTATLQASKTGTMDVERVAISPDGALIAALVQSRRNSREDEKAPHIRLWDARTRKELARLRGDGGRPGQLFAFTPDSARLVCAWRTAAHVWDVKAHKLIRQVPLKDVSGHTSAIT